MCIQSFGERAKAATLLRTELSEALEDRSVDEAVLIQAICASTTIYQGDTAGGLRQVAQALRMARRHHLYLRVNLLYRLAAANYEHMGKYRRAIRAQMRAIQSGYTIGMMDHVAIGWQRLAEYHRAIGMFGSALRFIDRAYALLADSSNAAHWSQVNRLRYELGTIVRSDGRHELAHRRSEWRRRVSDVSELGNFEMALGHYYQCEGQLVRARAYFASARGLAVKAGMPENATVAAGAEVRILYELGWLDRIDGPVKFVMRKMRGLSSINMRGERCVVAIWTAYMTRSKRQRIVDLAAEARTLWSELESAKTRMELALMLFRMFARDGKDDAARSWADLYVGELKRVFSNLNDTAQGEGVAEFLGMSGAMAEIDGFLKRSHGKLKRPTEGCHREPLSVLHAESSR
jgi:tetratricopeptide (TPR) repeat protein